MGEKKKIRELRAENEALKKALLGQTAMITFLTIMLQKKKVLNPLEARMVVMAGVDAKDHEDLAAGDIRKWAKENLTSMLKNLAETGESTPG